MPKRFIDSDIWKKPWFRKAPPKIKCLWNYLILNCSHSGIFEKDLDLFSYMIGEEITEEDFKSLDWLFHYIEKDKIFIPTFPLFQCRVKSYHDLSPKNNAQNSIIKDLVKYGLFDLDFLGASEPLGSPSLGAQETETETETETENINRRKKEKQTLEEIKQAKEASFRKEVSEIRSEFPELPDEQIEKFISYWTESKPKGKLLLWEQQKTFDLKRRLQNWAQNFETNFGRGTKGQGQAAGQRKTHSQNEAEKFRKGKDLSQKLLSGEYEMKNGKLQRKDGLPEGPVEVEAEVLK